MRGTMKMLLMAARDHMGRILHAHKMHKRAEAKMKNRG